MIIRLPGPTIVALVLSAAFLVITVACGVDGGGGTVPPLDSDFAIASSIPGWVLQPGSVGRDDVRAVAQHDGTRWNVVLSRPAERRPADMRFALAIADNGTHHLGVPQVLLTFDPAAAAVGDVVIGHRVANGAITPDGQVNAAEWNGAFLSQLQATAQNPYPLGTYPAQSTVDVIAGAAYDDEYIYFLFQWNDPTGTPSVLGPQLQWDGSQWQKRAHRANDTNGDGILGPGEPLVFAATEEDQDRFHLIFPIRDEMGAFAEGSVGCGASCHGNLALDPAGVEAVHAHVLNGDLMT